MRSICRTVLGLGAVLISHCAFAQSVVFVKADASPGGDGSSWAQALQDLQGAFDLASAPGNTIREIWVAAGTYRPDRGSGDRNASFNMRSGLMVLGGFSGVESSRRDRNWYMNRTILNGQLASASSYHVVTAVNVSADSLIDGFDITGGSANGTGAASQGGGLRAELSFLQVSDCTFRANGAYSGGAVYFLGGNPTFFNCIFTGNSATGNVAGLYCEAPASAPMFPAVINCTFSGNTATLNTLAPALSCISLGGSLTLRNSILWGNDYVVPAFYPAQADGVIDAAYCCQSQSWNWPRPWSGPNALYADPLIVNAAGPDGIPGTADDDLRILAGSPCIDSGDAASIPADRFDLNDNGNTSEPTPSDAGCGPRLYDDPARPNTGGGSPAYADMGAHEGPALAPVPDASLLAVVEGSSTPLQVHLTRPPPAPVQLTVATTGDPALSAAPPTLNFDASNWNTDQTVTVSSAHDPDSFSGSGTLTLAGPGLLRIDVALAQVDTDQPPGLVYVNWNATGANNGSSWADAFTSLQAALAYAAQSGGSVHEVWVAQGRYTPSPSSISTPFTLQNGVALYGGFAGTELGRTERDWTAHPTILSGDLLGDDGPNFTNTADNSIHVVVGTGTDSSAVLDGFTITAGSAVVQDPADSSRGGGLFVRLGRPTITNCTFAGNLARINGGAAYVLYNDQGGVAFTRCAFSGNKVGQSSGSGIGGALYADFLLAPGTLNISECTFTGNTANNRAGGAFLSGVVNLTDCTLTGNTALGTSFGGGGMVLQQNGLASTILRCAFRDHNLADGSGNTGGGCYVVGNGSAVFTNCTFTNNHAPSAGGLSGGSASLNVFVGGCTFDGNSASLGTGACGIGSVQPNAVHDCVFTSNSAVGGSNANYGALASGGFVSNCSFIGNSCTGTGGAGAAGRWTNCTFVNNSASGTGGGAIAYGNTGNIAYHCTFTGNHADGASATGGAIWGNISAVGCDFLQNTAGWRGGAVSFLNTAVNCTFEGNTAVDAGAVYLPNNLVNCALSGNAATGTAGAVWIEGGYLRNCSLSGNTANICGGVYVYRNTAVIRNSILYGNTQSTPGGGQDFQLLSSGHYSVVIDIARSNVQGWNGLLGGLANSGANPLFYNPAGPDGVLGTADDSLALAAGSPCIDSGDNSEVPPDMLDADGNGNTTEPTPLDASGAARFRDDPGSPDTGVGTAPIVDRGAFEFIPSYGTVFGCYANCDYSTVPPILNVNDFACFLNRYATGHPYANCDHSTTPPVLNVLDFACFLNKFAAGCP